MVMVYIIIIFLMKYTKETGLMEKNKVKVHINFHMEMFMKEIG